MHQVINPTMTNSRRKSIVNDSWRVCDKNNYEKLNGDTMLRMKEGNRKSRVILGKFHEPKIPQENHQGIDETTKILHSKGTQTDGQTCRDITWKDIRYMIGKLLIVMLVLILTILLVNLGKIHRKYEESKKSEIARRMGE